MPTETKFPSRFTISTVFILFHEYYPMAGQTVKYNSLVSSDDDAFPLIAARHPQSPQPASYNENEIQLPNSPLINEYQRWGQHQSLPFAFHTIRTSMAELITLNRDTILGFRSGLG
jgi:hypothetical protein